MSDSQILLQLSEIGARMVSGQPPKAVFQAIVEAVQALGFDRVRLDLVSPEGSSISLAAQHGFDGMEAEEPAPADQDPDFRALLSDPCPQVTGTERCEPEDSVTGDRGVVPLLLREAVIGKLTVDRASGGRPVYRTELDAVVPFANQAAIAQAMLWGASLETLQKTSLAITSMRDRQTLLTTIIEQAVKLLGAQSGGLYEYHPELAELTVIADYNRPEHVGRTLKIGEGMAGRIIQEHLPHMVELDYNNWEDRAPIYHDEREICSVLEVPLLWEESYIGVLYIDDKKGRSFSDIDIRLLRLFADQAAISLTNASLLQSDEDKLQRLERLAQSTRELMGNLDGMSLQERLMLIARNSAEILQAETAGVFRIHDGEIVLEAGYGQEGEFVPGLARRIHNEAQGGLTGYIAYHGKLFKAKGEELKSHFAVAGSPAHAPSGGCYSLLAIPLKKRTVEGEIPIGLIRADNKKSKDGKVLATLEFSAEDESILSIFAEAAAVAIESGELVDRLKERKDFQERLIASSPEGIVAVDRDGRVTEFNKRAEEILRFSRDKILGQPVFSLYLDPKEPHRLVHRLRHSADGYVRAHETVVLSSQQERIPIVQSSTWLFNAKGKRIGSVGYFQDLRQRKALERRESFLLWASNVVARARTLDEGLQSLAERLVSSLERSFCGILLLNEDDTNRSLTLRAASQGGNPTWSSSRQQIVLSEWPGLEKLLQVGAPAVRERSDDRARPDLERLSKLLGLPGEIHSLLVVPLKIGEQVVGQLDLGNLQGSSHTSFSKEDEELASAIASQITVLIHRMELLEIRERREQLLQALVQASLHIRADVELPVLRQVIVRLAAKLVRCGVGGLFLNLPHLRQLELVEVLNAPEELKGRHFSHADGLVGQVARERKIRVHPKPMSEDLFRTLGLDAVVAIPLRDASGEVEAVLFLGSTSERGPFGRTDLEILEAFATQAAIALRTARLMDREQLYFSQLAVLHRIRDYIQSTDSLEKILHAVLTGVTASYGLGFNRAVLLLLEETGEQLVGEIGIGELEDEQARSRWEYDVEKGLDNFETYLRKLKRNEIKPTPVGLRAKGIRLSARGSDLFSAVVADGQLRRITRDELPHVPSVFLNTFHVATPLVVAPVTAKGQVLGILVVDNKFTQAPIGNDGCNTLMTFAATAAVAIDNKRLLDQTHSSASKLFAFYQMSSELTSIQDPERLLRTIVDQTVSAAGASWVSILLIDKDGRTQNPVISDPRFVVDRKDPMPVRPKGISISRDVLETGQAHRIENVDKHHRSVNPSMIERFVKAAICLPLSLPGKRIGVMWIHYDEPRRFSDSEVAALQLYVNQAAVAYDGARRMERLEDLRAAFTAMTEAKDLKSVLFHLVESAKRVLKADSTVFWFYDSKMDDFIPEQSVYSGEHLTAWKELQMNGPQKKGTAFWIMSSDWMPVDDVRGRSQLGQEIGPTTRRFLEAIGGKSFQGVALKAGKEKEGVLYAIYSKPRRFDLDEQETALAFANRAALALKKAKLFDQVQRAQEAAEVVARVTLLEKPESTLMSIARETRDALGCGAVALFKYEVETGSVSHSALAGTHSESKAGEAADLPLVLAMVERDEPYVIPDVSHVEIFKVSRFCNAEKIMSCVALPLKAAGRKVGVMFVNYRNRRRFTGDELSIMELFANQAAVAMRNSQLFDERATKLGQQRALAELSKQLLAVKSMQEAMDRAVAFAATVLGTEFGNIILPDREGQLKFRAAYGWEESKIKDLVVEAGLGSQTGYTVQKEEPVRVDDYASETRFTVPAIVTEHDIRSGLSVPMFREGKIIGAMVVHTRRQRHFTDDDATLFSLIGNQTAIALERAKQYENNNRRSRYLGALYEASKSIASHFGLERREILDEIVKAAVEGITGINGPKALLATLQLYDADKHELILESFYPQDLEADLSLVGERRQIKRLLRNNQRIGVTGRTALDGEPHLVMDVNANTDYVAFNPRTRSAVAVPLLDQGKVIGVLNAESDLLDAFDKEDEEALQALAELAVIAIRSVQQVEELKETRLLASTQTTLALMGIGNAVRRHEMAGYVAGIRNDLFLLKKELPLLGPGDERIKRVLERVDRMARAASKMDKTLTERPDARLGSVLINKDLIRTWSRRFDGKNFDPPLHFKTLCQLDNSASTRANVFWLQRVLDILVNNAVEATKAVPEREITLGSRQRDQRAEVYVQDNGGGVPNEIRGKLFREPVEKPKGEKGLGVGLLVAHAIVQSYGGTIYVEERSLQGATMVVSLPLEIN
jgi:PAS domain S-box-containing protein